MSHEVHRPLPDLLELRSPKPGTYVHQAHLSVCFGAMVFGGYLASLIHKVCADFTAQSSKTANHHDVHHSNIQFFRPVFPAPYEIVLTVTIASANKGWTALHAELAQEGKVCNAGYVTLTDFSTPGSLTLTTNWCLSPPTPPVDLEALAKDADPRWVTIHTPWDLKQLRKAHMYLSQALPLFPPSLPNTLNSDQGFRDQWIRAKWPETPDKPAVWTDELIPYIFDSAMPYLPQEIDPSWNYWGRKIETAKEQARARARGDADSEMGYIDKQTGADVLFPWVAATLSMNFEIKKKLPREGVRYLMLRSVVKSVVDNRADYDLTLMDEGGELVAVGNQVMRIVPIEVKQDKKHPQAPKL